MTMIHILYKQAKRDRILQRFLRQLDKQQEKEAKRLRKAGILK